MLIVAVLESWQRLLPPRHKTLMSMQLRDCPLGDSEVHESQAELGV